MIPRRVKEVYVDNEIVPDPVAKPGLWKLLQGKYVTLLRTGIADKSPRAPQGKHLFIIQRR